jgi:hypothetical protein
MVRTITTPSRPYKTPCDNPIEQCPECGGLECLCRPRFFAGQLLTDEDLNRLDHYIVAKNKLHNRYLFGWGVVCGLDVVCHPCNMVAVRPGYALSPCGEDIIVCEETVVDVCSLINACRPKPDPCAPIDAAKDTCTDTTDKWVLAIRYNETPSRGVTPLKSSSGSACCSRCSCGGSSGCGCKPNPTPFASFVEWTELPSRPAPPPQCEPTLVCEGYTFEVCKLPPQNPRQIDFGALIDALRCCFKIFQQHLVLPPADHSIPSLKSWCCSLRESIAELFAAHPGHSCTIAELISVMCGNPDANTNTNTYITQVMTAAITLLTRFVLDCICSALLPPCPGPVNDDRIFLATITVQRKDCKIIEICNWDERRFVITFQTLRYWLSWLPFVKNLKAIIARLCCRPLPAIGKAFFAAGAFDHMDPKLADRMNRAQPPANIDEYSSDLAAIFQNAMRNHNREVTPETLVMAAFGVGDAQGQPLLTPEEMANPSVTMMMHQFVRPLLDGFLSQFGTTIPGTPASQDELATLRATVAAQQQAIDALTARLDNL